jgi:hypothetical protein
VPLLESVDDADEGTLSFGGRIRSARVTMGPCVTEGVDECLFGGVGVGEVTKWQLPMLDASSSVKKENGWPKGVNAIGTGTSM